MRKALSFTLMLVDAPHPAGLKSIRRPHSATCLGLPFAYFQQVEGRFDEFLRRLRPEKLSLELKERALKKLP
jgi:hypothetical protein